MQRRYTAGSRRGTASVVRATAFTLHLAQRIIDVTHSHFISVQFILIISSVFDTILGGSFKNMTIIKSTLIHKYKAISEKEIREYKRKLADWMLSICAFIVTSYTYIFLIHAYAKLTVRKRMWGENKTNFFYSNALFQGKKLNRYLLMFNFSSLSS